MDLFGRLEQVGGVEPLVLDDGPARGVRAIRLERGEVRRYRLEFEVSPTAG